LSESAREHLLTAFQHLEDRELAHGGTIVWGVSAAIEAELKYRIDSPSFRNELSSVSELRPVHGLGSWARALQYTKVRDFVGRLGIDVSRLSEVLKRAVPRRNPAVHGGTTTLSDARAFWDEIVEKMRAFEVLQK
jgi:hypothetical protein